MKLGRLRLGLDTSPTWGIGRRYFVVNGFDGALTMLGLLTGFRLAGDGELGVVVTACLGAAVALAVSGVSSAYLSEAAERRRSLSALEGAMLTDLSETAHGSAARMAPLLIALVNGAAPLLVSLLIVAPLWLAHAGVDLPGDPLMVATCTAFLCIFGLGIFLGHIGGTSWLQSGIKTLLIAAATVVIIVLLESRI